MDLKEHRAELELQGWPYWISWEVKPAPRSRRITVEIKADGLLVASVPPHATAVELGRLVRAHRGSLLTKAAKMRDRGPHLMVKDLVPGEGFPLVGHNYRLHLVTADGRAGEGYAQPSTRHPGVRCIDEPGPSTWSGIKTRQLTLMYGGTAADVMQWYRAKGEEVLARQMPQTFARLGLDPAGWQWTVRPARPAEKFSGTWAICYPTKKVITFAWWAFQLPKPELDYLIEHEAAHAHPKGDGHGKGWQRLMDMLCPAWPRHREVLKWGTGLKLWLGQTSTPAALTLAERRAAEAAETAPFVSEWAGV